MIALSTHNALKRLSRASAVDGRVRPADFPPPWEHFRNDVAAKAETMIVSHRPSRKITGALHEETRYGRTGEGGIFVTRKEVEKLTASMLEDIRDETVRTAVAKAIEKHGDAKKASEAGISLASGNGGTIPVKKVRVLSKMSEGSFHSFKGSSAAPYGSNHHVELFESPDCSMWKGRFVTTMEAARRARIGREQIVNRTPDEQGWKFVMSLAVNEIVSIGNGDTARLYRLQKMSGPTQQIVFRSLESGRVDLKGDDFINIMPNPLKKQNCRKLTISVLGEIQEAHD